MNWPSHFILLSLGIDLLQEYNGRDECENAEIKLVKKTGLAAAAVSAETLGLKNKD